MGSTPALGTMGIRRLLGLTTQSITIKSHERTLLKPWNGITVEEFKTLLEARRLMAGKPLRDDSSSKRK